MKSALRSSLIFPLIISQIIMPFGLGSRQARADGEIKPVPKPLQFVLLAFDGSERIDRWEDTRNFANVEMKGKVKFTYFISGVMFLHRKDKSGKPSAGGTYKGAPIDDVKLYQHPHTHRQGASDIGFSTDFQTTKDRIVQMNLAFKEGHEMGSHANGHFNSSEWTPSEWDTEFDDFNRLMFDTVYTGSDKKGHLDRSSFMQGMEYKVSDIKGFRTPYLSYNQNLFPVLKKYGFTYDTSKSGDMNYWPKKKDGIWNFPLGEMPLAKISGTVYAAKDKEYDCTNGCVLKNDVAPWQKNKRGEPGMTLSMDWNFYVSQYKDHNDPNDKEKYEQKNKDFYTRQMLETYRSYFRTNYYGNRAPVHIGHHFSLWNSGGYWEAMKQIAREVCVLEDVRCITYSELQEFMEKVTPQELAAYQAGKFTSESVGKNLKLTQSKRPEKWDKFFAKVDRKIASGGIWDAWAKLTSRGGWSAQHELILKRAQEQERLQKRYDELDNESAKRDLTQDELDEISEIKGQLLTLENESKNDKYIDGDRVDPERSDIHHWLVDLKEDAQLAWQNLKGDISDYKYYQRVCKAYREGNYGLIPEDERAHDESDAPKYHEKWLNRLHSQIQHALNRCGGKLHK